MYDQPKHIQEIVPPEYWQTYLEHLLTKHNVNKTDLNWRTKVLLLEKGA
jgi:hypothetical protein